MNATINYDARTAVRGSPRTQVAATSAARLQWALRGDLSLEPGAGALPAADVRLPNPGGMRHLWQERRTSTMAVDQSGVWRFRELLPIVRDVERVVTLREGNTPLYEMPRCAEIVGVDWLLAKHQGMNPPPPSRTPA